MTDWKSRLSDIYASPAHKPAAPSAATPAPAHAVEPAAVASPPPLQRPATRPTVRLLGRRSVAVRALDVAPDAQTIVVAHADGQVRLLRAASGLLLQSLALPGDVQCLALSADGRWLAVAVAVPARPGTALGTGGPPCEVRLINLKHGTLEHTLAIAARGVQALAFHPSGCCLAVAAGPTLELWDPWSGHPQHSLKGHALPVSCLGFSADGQWLVSGDPGGHLQVWRAGTGQAVSRLEHQGELSSLALSGDGRWLAWGTRDGSVLVSAWTPEDLGRVRQIEGQGLPVAGLRFSPDQRWLVIGKGGAAGPRPPESATAPAPQGLVRLWNTDSGALAAEHALGDVPVTALAPSPDGRWLAVGTPRGEVRLLASDDGRALRQFPREAVGISSMALSPDHQWLASGREDGQVSVWHAQKGELLREMTVHRSRVSAVGFSADGHWWASGADDGTVLLWGRGKAHPLHARPGLRCLGFCPQSQRLALAGSGGAVQLLTLREPLGKDLPVVYQAPDGIVGLRFSTHGDVLVWAGDTGRVTTWAPTSGQVRSQHQLPLHGALNAFALSDDLRWLAASTAAGQLLLWDLNLDRLAWQHAHVTHTQGTPQLLFDADNQTLHLSSQDGSQLDWAVATGQALGAHAGAAPHYACLGLAQARAALHAHALGTDEGLRLLQT